MIGGLRNPPLRKALCQMDSTFSGHRAQFLEAIDALCVKAYGDHLDQAGTGPQPGPPGGAMSSTSSLYARLMLLHQSSYLTLLSIVQGVAMGFLGAGMPSQFDPTQWLLFLATFIFLVLVWAEYNMGVASLSWIPTFRDALIPFALCMNEILLSRLLARPREWFFAAALFCVIGFLAFLNMYSRARLSAWSPLRFS